MPIDFAVGFGFGFQLPSYQISSVPISMALSSQLCNYGNHGNSGNSFPRETLDVSIQSLGTEQQNVASAELDTRSALEIARIINAEDGKVAAAVEKALPQIAQAIDVIAKAIGQGGHLIYVGAGTSGRIAALDATECPPTFNTSPKTVQYVIAGGN